MARIIAPNKQYAGVSAGVPFTGGEGHTDNEYLIKWFQRETRLSINNKTILQSKAVCLGNNRITSKSLTV